MKESTGFFGDPLPTSGETGAELTVRELEEMACRQQHQIESQRQLLAAKEQRLRYLKQHDAKHHQVAAEHERLRRLRDRVEAQEQKLRKLRALRGQVDQTKLNNATLTSDLESIRALFNEKEKELTMAVAKVDELTRQLEDVQKGRGHSQPTSPASMELDKLRAELLYRNKLGEQQTARLVQQREVLSKRQEEMASIDRRISELQARLHRKRLLNQQLANQIQANKPGQNNRSLGGGGGGGPGKQMMPLCDGKMSSGNVAAIEPFNHVPDAMSKHSQLRKSEDNILSHATGDPQPYGVGGGPRNVGRTDQKPPSQQQPLAQKQPAASDPYLLQPPYLLQQQQQQQLSNNCNVYQKPEHHMQQSAHHHHHHTNGVGPPHHAAADLAYFGGSKFDPKYQTLPYNTKFSPLANYNGNQYPPPQPPQQWCGQYGDGAAEDGVGTRDLVNNNINNNSSGGGGGAGYGGDQKLNGMTIGKKSAHSGHVLGQNVQMQSSSRPINAQVYHTKPLSSSNHLAQRPLNYSGHQPVLSTRSQPVGGTGLSNHQKPTSSVSPIYQTSSTKVQPVQPQVLNSVHAANHQAAAAAKDAKPPVAAAAAAATTSTTEPQPTTGACAATADRAGSPSTVGKPALPPKPPPPLVKTSTPPPPPRQNAYHHLPPQHHQYQHHQHQHQPPDTAQSKDQLTTPPPPRIPNGTGPAKSNFANSIDSSESDNSSSSASIRSVFGNVKNGGHQLLDGVRLMNISTKGSPPPPPPPAPPAATITSPHADAVKETFTNEVKQQPSRLPSLVTNRTTSYPVTDPLADKVGKTNLVNHHNHHQQQQQQQQQHQQQQPNRTTGIPVPLQQQKAVQPVINSTSAVKQVAQEQAATDETDRVHAVSVAQRIDELETRFGGGGGGGVSVGGCAVPVDGGGSSSADDNSTSNHSSSPLDSGQDSGKDDVSVECRNRLLVRKKGNLKESSGSVGHKRRVSFDPLALLLDASLEGELELVMRTAEQVGDPSAANDEGITALHNAICAGHIDIVKFLVKFGCDVNAQDSDGWTPLHCAASCNNLAMVRFLVEHGACIFATTLSDQETAAEKCEEDEEGFDGCSEFLYSVQEKLGIMNNGVVFAVFAYEAHNQDELTFDNGDRIVVLRKGDDAEREWWWSRIDDREGYVPRNLLGLYPRVANSGGSKNSSAPVAE